MKAECHLVIAKARGGGVAIKRVTQRKPTLAPNEALIHLSLDLPRDVFEDPLVTVPVERRQIAVAIEVDEQ